MTIVDFIKLELKMGDYIWIMNEKGEGFPGTYDDNYNSSKKTFQFRNHSNGKIQIIEIIKLQRLDITNRKDKPF